MTAAILNLARTFLDNHINFNSPFYEVAKM